MNEDKSKSVILHFYDDYEQLLDKHMMGAYKLSKIPFEMLFRIFEDMHLYRKYHDLNLVKTRKEFDDSFDNILKNNLEDDVLKKPTLEDLLRITEGDIEASLEVYKEGINE